MLKTHGITSETMNSMVLGAGVLYKNLTYTAEDGWVGTVLGATAGGIKFNYQAEFLEIQVDGVTVAVKGITHQKVGETASLSGQMTELTPDLLKLALHLEEETCEDGSYLCYSSKSDLDDGDYLTNIAYVGTLSGGGQIIIILPNAICTEAVELETKNATQTTYAVKFECTADLSGDSLDHLPLEIYYPKLVITDEV